MNNGAWHSQPTGRLHRQEVTAAELAAYMRSLADEIERCDIHEGEGRTYIDWQRGMVEGEPVAGEDGRRWATWTDDGTRRVHFRYHLLNVDGKGE